MGLDMYLTASNYISNYDKAEAALGKKIEKLFPEIAGIPDVSVCGVVIRLMYWRKDNHIHQWFVDNCQEGEDDCRRAYVSVDQLKELAYACRQILGEKEEGSRIELAKELLPTREGFFFGSTEYDEGYFKSLKETADRIDVIVSKWEGCSEWSIHYHSSW